MIIMDKKGQKMFTIEIRDIKQTTMFFYYGVRNCVAASVRGETR